MTATTFDTLAAMRRLEAAGIDAEQAEAIIDTMRESAGELSTKSDIDRLDSRLNALESRLNTLQWVVGIQSAITLATFGIVAAKLL
jgi:polyhydroxyalkanoate synthesis regulator phasin